jgi:ligand-binding SRPBCC domain-containing protein
VIHNDTRACERIRRLHNFACGETITPPKPTDIVPTYEKHSVLDVDPATLFSWHVRPGAFERLAPPWEHLRVLSRYGGIADGSRLTMEIRRGRLKIRWEALHRGFVDGVQFQDVQVAGPFKRWVHTHRVEDAGHGRAQLIDHVDYALPFGPIGAIVGGLIARRMIERLFGFRHRRIASDLARHRSIGKGRRLRLVLTGRTGFVLTQLAAFLSTGGHLVHVFPTSEDVRVGPTHSAWGPKAVPDFAALEQADAVVHMGLHALPNLLASLDERRSRVHTVVALPTTAAADQPQVESQYLEEAINSSPRRVIVPLTPGVLAASAPLEGGVPREALSPSVDGALVGLDDLIGATYFALCDDAVKGIVDVTLRREGETAAVPADVARWVPEVRVLQLRSPQVVHARRLVEFGFQPSNLTLADTIRCETGWPT